MSAQAVIFPLRIGLVFECGPVTTARVRHPANNVHKKPFRQAQKHAPIAPAQAGATGAGLFRDRLEVLARAFDEVCDLIAGAIFYDVPH